MSAFVKVRNQRAPATWMIGSETDMAGIQAGIIGVADVSSQEAQQGTPGAAMTPATTWTYIWVGAALFYLLGVYFGQIRIAGREG